MSTAPLPKFYGHGTSSGKSSKERGQHGVDGEAMASCPPPGTGRPTNRGCEQGLLQVDRGLLSLIGGEVRHAAAGSAFLGVLISNVTARAGWCEAIVKTHWKIPSAFCTSLAIACSLLAACALHALPLFRRSRQAGFAFTPLPYLFLTTARPETAAAAKAWLPLLPYLALLRLLDMLASACGISARSCHGQQNRPGLQRGPLSD